MPAFNNQNARATAARIKFGDKGEPPKCLVSGLDPTIESALIDVLQHAGCAAAFKLSVKRSGHWFVAGIACGESQKQTKW